VVQLPARPLSDIAMLKKASKFAAGIGRRTR